MGESQDDTLRSNATVMKNNILYRPEYRDIFVTIMRNYNEVVSSRALLRDLVETVHIYLRLVEHFCMRKGKVLVQGKRKKRGAGSRRKKSRKEAENDPVVLSTDQVCTAHKNNSASLTFNIYNHFDIFTCIGPLY